MATSSDGERSRRHTSPLIPRGRSRSTSPDPTRHRSSGTYYNREQRTREGSAGQGSRDDRNHRDRPSPSQANDGERTHHRESYDARRSDERYRIDRRSRDDYREALYGGFDQGLDEKHHRRDRDSGGEKQRKEFSPDGDRRKFRSRTRSRTRSRSPQNTRPHGRPVHRPSAFLRIHHLPADVDEGELQALFAPIPGVVRLSLDPRIEDHTLSSYERTALLQMAALEPAMALMDTDWRASAYYRDRRFRLEYTPPPSPPRGILGDSDWLCPACGSLNFSRRSQCYHCRGHRTAEAKAVDPDEPSHVLRISNLEDTMEENALEELIKPLAPVKTLRLSRDKVTGGSRGTAFVYFYSTDDATAVMEKLDGCQIEGQRWKLRISYARDRLDPLSSSKRATTGVKGKPGQKEEENVGWEPKAFDEAAIAVETDANAQQALGVVAPVVNNTAERLFENDAETGYLRDPATGYLYDAGTGYYFNPTLQQWGTLDAQTGGFAAYTDGHSKDPMTRKGEPLPTKESFGGHAEIVAVINAEPQLDPQALLDAARAKVNPAGENEQERKGAAKDPESSEKKAGVVQGIVHRGKWAQRAAARKAEMNSGA